MKLKLSNVLISITLYHLNFLKDKTIIFRKVLGQKREKLNLC